MSFDIFVQCFEHGNPAPISRAVIDREFGSLIRSRSEGFRQAAYDDGGLADIYVKDEGEIDGFMISRPPKSPAFWASVFNVLRETRSVLYWPGGGRASLVVIADVVEHLPPDFIETLGEPLSQHQPQKFQNALRQPSFKRLSRHSRHHSAAAPHECAYDYRAPIARAHARA